MCFKRQFCRRFLNYATSVLDLIVDEIIYKIFVLFSLVVLQAFWYEIYFFGQLSITSDSIISLIK